MRTGGKYTLQRPKTQQQEEEEEFLFVFIEDELGIILNAYESPIHELSYAVLLVSILQVFFEIWHR